ncbi:MAG: efflux RND transporter permease subunit, partial [Bacteroidota bacterium]
AIGDIRVKTASGKHIPLRQLVDIHFVRGPQVIKSENTFLVGYVLFDKANGVSEIAAVEAAQAQVQAYIEAGALRVPSGVTFTFTGNYENHVRASKRLSLVLPAAILVILLLLYFQFNSFTVTLIVGCGVAVAFAGGFLMLWLYGVEGMFDFSVFGTNMAELFQVDTVHLSVAVWVGFIALFGIATDDGVVMATYLRQVFKEREPADVREIREAVVTAGKRRIRPCLMTTATTLLALLPILTATGRGADIMLPMAIPVFGGMAVELVTLLVVPVLYAWWQEKKWKGAQNG